MSNFKEKRTSTTQKDSKSDRIQVAIRVRPVIEREWGSDEVVYQGKKVFPSVI
jgi:hypothetical protein